MRKFKKIAITGFCNLFYSIMIGAGLGIGFYIALAVARMGIF